MVPETARLRASLNASEKSLNGLDNVRDHIKSKISGGVTYGAGDWKNKDKWHSTNQNHSFLKTTKLVKHIHRDASNDSPEYGKNELNLANTISVTNLFSVKKNSRLSREERQIATM